MKKNVLLLCAALILSTTFLSGQDGRPQYKIRNERAGVFIGDIVIELFPYVAPLHVANFDSLVAISFYDSLAWHRVVPNFVIQGGDPNSKNGPRSTWGEGDSTQATVPAEFSKVTHARGIIGAARDTDINSANSQFYINTINNSGLDGRYTAYGIVVDGMDVVDNIEASPRDANDNPLEKIEMFITRVGSNKTVPEVPVITEPADSMKGFNPNSPFIWSAVDGAVLYFLEIATDYDFNETVYQDTLGAQGSSIKAYYKEAELGENTYYWRIRCNNGAKFSEYSEVRTYTTSIPGPTLLLPPSGITNIEDTPVLSWEPLEGVDSYRLQVVPTFPSFIESKMIFNEGGIEDTEVQIGELISNTKYFWRVLGEVSDYDSPYSEIWNFTTGELTNVIDNNNLVLEYSIEQNYPNPFNPTTTIKFGLPEQGFVDLRVYNILGQEVANLVNKELSAGYHQVNFGFSNLASGVYIYKIDVNGKFSSVKKMLMIK